MTLFIDASAFVSLVVGEEDADDLADRLDASSDRLTSGLAIWETTVALVRLRGSSVDQARVEIERYRTASDIRVVAIGEREAGLALEAYRAYGKSRHPAALNLGDCFAYACAKANGARLLYKGDDFSKTDLA